MNVQLKKPQSPGWEPSPYCNGLRPLDTRERAAAALRVASCVVFCSVWVALHWSQIDGLHRLWVPSAAAVGLHTWRRRGLAAARDEVCGAIYDFLRPAAACLRAWHDPSWRESYQRLMLALNTASCHFTSYGPVCKTTWILACVPYEHGVLAVWDQAEHFSGGVPPALLTGWLLALVFTWQCTVVANNLSHHRYYAHRSYDTSRPVALALGVLGCAATQRGPLWWSSNHRRHHRFCETAEDPHSPAQQGVVYAHCGWFCDRANFPIRPEYCGEWLERPELLLLDANVELVSSRLRGWLTRGVLRLLVWCAAAAGAPPSLRLQYLTRYTTDTQLLALSLSLHWSSFVNSMCHDWAPAPSCGGGGGGGGGKGPCVGLSIPWVGLLSGGEGFHSRHHQNARNARHAEDARHDLVYLVTCALERLGLVWSVQRQEAAGEARAGQRRADLKAD